MIRKIYANVSIIVQIIRYKVEARKRVFMSNARLRKAEKELIKTMVDYAHLELSEALLNDEEWAIKFVLEKWS